MDPADILVEGPGLAEERRAVRAAFVALPAEQQVVIQLMYFDGLSLSGVALWLGVSPDAVRSRTLLGMRDLREAMCRIRG